MPQISDLKRLQANKLQIHRFSKIFVYFLAFPLIFIKTKKTNILQKPAVIQLFLRLWLFCNIGIYGIIKNTSAKPSQFLCKCSPKLFVPNIRQNHSTRAFKTAFAFSTLSVILEIPTYLISCLNPE